MKILKYILLAILVLVVLFFAMGIFNPTIKYGAEITVDKPLKEAWAVSKDESKYGEWLKGFKSIELIEGEQDAIGSKYKVVVYPGEGQDEFEMVQTLVALEEFDHVKLHYKSDLMEFEQKIIHTGSDEQATIRSESRVIPKGMVARSMFAIMETFGGAFRAQEEKNFNALKNLIEENTTDYFPEPMEEIAEDTVSEGESE